MSWTLNGATQPMRCATYALAFWKVKATREGASTEELSLSVDCVNGAWQSEVKTVPSGVYTVVVEGHAGPSFSGLLVAAVTKQVTVPAGATLTTAALELAIGNVQLPWTVDGVATGAATVCPARGVTFWSASFGDGSAVGVNCVAGQWSAPFKAVPAGSPMVRVEAHSGTPFSGPLKVSKNSTVTMGAGDDVTVNVNFLGSEF